MKKLNINESLDIIERDLFDVLNSFSSGEFALAEVEVRVLIARFIHNETFDKIAAKENLTRERIRQIEWKGLRKLRHPARLIRFFFFKYPGLQTLFEAKIRERVQKNLLEIKEFIAKIDAGIDDRDIRNLELSIRAQNAMIDANISTIGQLVNHQGSELLSLRNFGKVSLREVELRLKEIGLTLKK